MRGWLKKDLAFEIRCRRQRNVRNIISSFIKVFCKLTGYTIYGIFYLEEDVVSYFFIDDCYLYPCDVDLRDYKVWSP